jgi:hypothetical protein
MLSCDGAVPTLAGLPPHYVPYSAMLPRIAAARFGTAAPSPAVAVLQGIGQARVLRRGRMRRLMHTNR